MFDRIAPRYDFLNRALSARFDVSWRRRMEKYLPQRPSLDVLDLATGTGDQIIFLAERVPAIRSGVGIDLAEKMLEIGRGKIAAKGLSGRVDLRTGDALKVPCSDASFDATTMSFGIRNVLDVDLCLREMLRVLRPGGRSMILECSVPSWQPLRALYLFYFRHILPRLAGLISGDGSAYRYLNQTVETFPQGEAFCALMEKAGFKNVTCHRLTGGIASLYVGDKT